MVSTSASSATRPSLRSVPRCRRIDTVPSSRSGGRAPPALGPRGGHRLVHPVDAVDHDRRREVVEVGEVAVEHTLGDPGLDGHGPTGQGVGAVCHEHSLGGLEQTLGRIVKGNSGGQGFFSSFSPVRVQLPSGRAPCQVGACPPRPALLASPAGKDQRWSGQATAKHPVQLWHKHAIVMA
jgi:hypothetical protein